MPEPKHISEVIAVLVRELDKKRLFSAIDDKMTNERKMQEAV